MFSHSLMPRRTESLDISHLEHETRPILTLGWAIAVAFHILLVLVVREPAISPVSPPPVVRPIRVTLKNYHPRLAEPFTVQRREAVRRVLQRYLLPTPGAQFRQPPSVRELMNIADDQGMIITEEEATALIREASEAFDKGFRAAFNDTTMKRAGYDDIPMVLKPLERIDPRSISLRGELLSIESLDTGQYAAIIIKDPTDKTRLTGILHLPAAIYGTTLVPAGAVKQALRYLADGISSRTGIKASIDREVSLDTSKLQRYPVVYIAADTPFDLTANEARSLREYLLGGGFVLIEPYADAADPALRQIVRDVFDGKASIQQVPVDDPILRCFFDIEREVTPHNGARQDHLTDIDYLLAGIFVGDRIVGLFLNGDYGPSWASGNFDTPYFRTAVNAVVYSLIRQGSVARQYINEDP